MIKVITVGLVQIHVIGIQDSDSKIIYRFVLKRLGDLSAGFSQKLRNKGVQSSFDLASSFYEENMTTITDEANRINIDAITDIARVNAIREQLLNDIEKAAFDPVSTVRDAIQVERERIAGLFAEYFHIDQSLAMEIIEKGYGDLRHG